MQFSAKARNIHCSPGKLRPLINAIRGKNVDYALNILITTPIKRVVSVKKVIESAAANAKNLRNIEASDLMIKDIRVDQGRMFRYSKPGAMGRVAIQRRRFSHISVVLEYIEDKED